MILKLTEFLCFYVDRLVVPGSWIIPSNVFRGEEGFGTFPRHYDASTVEADPERDAILCRLGSPSSSLERCCWSAVDTAVIV